MSFLTKEKFLSKEWFYNYSLIAIGSFILAAGFVYFIDPHKIVPGGVYGIGIVVKNITSEIMGEGIKIPFIKEPIFSDGLGIGFVGLMLNIPLTILGIKILGPRFGVKTVVGFVLSSFFIDFLDEAFDGALVDDVLLSCIFGGVLIGFGLGLIFKSKATSGGSDIIAMIAAKHTQMSLGFLLIIVDSVIVFLGLIVFKDWKIPLYSWIVIYITGKVIDATMQGVSYDKALFIISDKYEEIRNKIIYDLNRGGTLINGVGMYKGIDKKIIFTNVNRRELAIIQDFIKDIDPAAFMTVIDANEVIGNGFKPIREVVA
ncbi:MAG TPA: YitT family protein [Bacteroidales bacterium]|nr:YitT family protein [Bacteroidales bacterium]